VTIFKHYSASPYFLLAMLIECSQLLYSVKSGNSKLEPSIQMIKDDFSFATNPPHQPDLDWLSTFDYQSRHEELRRLRAPGTGTWLLDDSEAFKTWASGCAADGQKRPNNVLWCHGVPGSGKSIMMYDLASNQLSDIS